MKKLILEVKGFKKCPAWLKRKYREACNFTCMEYHKKELTVGKLEPHRLKRGNQFGLYTLLPLNHPNSNVKIVCKDCHKGYHQKEMGCGK